MIDEKVLIERLEKYSNIAKCMWDDDSNDDYYVGKVHAYEYAIEIANELAKETIHESSSKSENVLESSSGWIPCKEMLFPRYGQKVFATVITDIRTLEVVITKYEMQEHWHNGIVKAWQPLPAPYKGKQK